MVSWSSDINLNVTAKKVVLPQAMHFSPVFASAIASVQLCSRSHQLTHPFENDFFFFFKGVKRISLQADC